MVLASSSVGVLLQELASGDVVPDPYSRRSAFGRYEPLLATTVLALIAIIAGMMLGGVGGRSTQPR